MSRFSTSWEIFKRSCQVMMERPKLLVFPILISLCTGLIMAFFILPIALQSTGHRLTEIAHWTAVRDSLLTPESVKLINSPEGAAMSKEERRRNTQLNNKYAVYSAIIYFAAMFLATFFNVAFCSQILSALRGGEVSIGDGLNYAIARLPAIFLWSLLAGLVGYVIQQLQQRFQIVGRIIIGLIGVAWSVACVFVIPVLVEDPAASNPFEALKRSANTFRKAWGETVIGYLGINIAGFLIITMLFLCIIVGFLLSMVAGASWVLFAMLLVTWTIGTFVIGYLSNVASQIYVSALYLYATTGRVPSQFDPAMMNAAWKHQ